MADKPQSLAEEYYVKDKQEKPVEAKEVEKESALEETVVEKTAEETTPVAATAAEESSEVVPPPEESTEEQSSGSFEEEKSGDEDAAEETPEIKLETAPADFRFPTTNQTRHCFTRYVEYHRCVAAKGEGAPECDKFAKYYRSLCPGEWEIASYMLLACNYAFLCSKFTLMSDFLLNQKRVKSDNKFILANVRDTYSLLLIGPELYLYVIEGSSVKLTDGTSKGRMEHSRAHCRLHLSNFTNDQKSGDETQISILKKIIDLLMQPYGLISNNWCPQQTTTIHTNTCKLLLLGFRPIS
ncbi:hypothetical protein Ahy_A07g036428 isoform A [Arachis hypogaea]|uniref:Cytochrome c oxidase subunit 6b-1 n=1 Tax=Arachis hypogaea TaxID=3818 RepID=A0A445CG57_ARAHY|nr:hypothetical protein Ahy_A07g036428 isoform A [Arachis hypogaea]